MLIINLNTGSTKRSAIGLLQVKAKKTELLYYTTMQAGRKNKKALCKLFLKTVNW